VVVALFQTVCVISEQVRHGLPLLDSARLAPAAAAGQLGLTTLDWHYFGNLVTCANYDMT